MMNIVSEFLSEKQKRFTPAGQKKLNAYTDSIERLDNQEREVMAETISFALIIADDMSDYDLRVAELVKQCFNSDGKNNYLKNDYKEYVVGSPEIEEIRPLFIKEDISPENIRIALVIWSKDYKHLNILIDSKKIESKMTYMIKRFSYPRTQNRAIDKGNEKIVPKEESVSVFDTYEKENVETLDFIRIGNNKVPLRHAQSFNYT